MAAARRCTPDQTALLSTLRSFGLPSFRPNQLEAITCTLQGKDVLLVLPTGGGKSLAYQLPAVAVDGCFTVVVSPLIALAQDQVRCLRLASKQAEGIAQPKLFAACP